MNELTDEAFTKLSAQNNGPLAGVRVIDMATVVMGPYAAQILGDLGADVIKIESPVDTARFGVYAKTPGMAALSMNVNRNKRSVNLDLKSEEGRAAAIDLLGTADILISNMRISALKRLGMDYDSLKKKLPNLIYVHAQGFRPDSGAASLAAYDETVQAASGLLDVANRAADIQKPVVLPTIIADKVSALTMVYSSLAALVSRQNGGYGQLVEVPMTDTMLAFNMVEHLQGKMFEPALTETGFPLSMNPGHYARPTKDGELAMVIPYSSQNFKDVFTASGHEEWLDDPAVNNEGGIDSRKDGPALAAKLDECVPALTLAEWGKLCAENSIPFGPVLKLDEAEKSEYVQQGHLLDLVEHPTEGPVRMVGIPTQFSGTPATVRRLAPVQGSDTEEVLAELRDSAAAKEATVELDQQGVEVA